MSVGQLAHPEWWTAVALGFGLVAVALGAARWLAARRRRRLMGAGPPPAGGPLSSDAALLVALACIGAALLGPRIGERLVTMTANGVDVTILVDVSRSMDAEDTPPSRLTRARHGVEGVLARLEPQDRVALATFAGHGVVLTPLTPDRGALAELITALDTELIHPASSNLQAGLDAAFTAFQAGSDRPRAIFVLSDGEKTPGSDSGPAAVVSPAAEVRVVAVAIGTELGSAVPDHGVPLRDLSGRVVVSRRNTQRLRQLAEETDGAFFATDEWGAFDFDAAVAALRRDAGARPGEPLERRVPAVRVAPFAALAFALLLTEGLPRPRRPRGRARLRALHALAVLGSLALMGAAPESADDRAQVPTPALVEHHLRSAPDDPRLLFALGRARLTAGDSAGAARAFSAAAIFSSTPALAARAHYALGVAELERGELERARDAFFDALAFEPDDARAHFNLEWTLLALTRKPPEMPEPPRAPDPHAAEREREEPDPRAEDEAEPSPGETAPEEMPRPALSDAQRQRSLERVRDDLQRAVRASARAAKPPEPDPRRLGPVW